MIAYRPRMGYLKTALEIRVLSSAFRLLFSPRQLKLEL
jgi:hypothetical protein